MKVIVDGLAIEYTENGSGSPLLLLHGWGSSTEPFSDLITELSKSHHVYAPNLPGFDGSERPKSIWGVADYAQFVAAFCNKVGIEPEVILGHSFGGQTAVNIVGNKLLNPKKLVLIAASAIRPTADAKNRSIGLLAKVGKTLIGKTSFGQAARKRLYGSLGSSEYLADIAMQPIYRRVITEDQGQSAAKITCPTLLIWGESDVDAPLERGKKLNQLIKGSKLKIYSGGHFIFREAKNEVTPDIVEFIK